MVDNRNNWQHPISAPKTLLFLIGLIFLSTLIGVLIIGVISMINGQEMSDLLSGLSKNSSFADRNSARWTILVNHLFTFIIPSILLAWLLYRNNWKSYFSLKPLRRTMNPILGGALMILAIPITGLLYWLNQQIPLPDVLLQMESSTNGMIESILMTESSGEIIFNIFLIAIIPAIGEELLFRGHFQQQLSRIFQNHHAGIIIGGIIFSAIHFQFEGFIPRFFLGALLGYLFYWTGNIWVPIIAHFANNGFQVIGVYMSGEDISNLSIDEVELPSTWQLLIFIGLAALLAYYIYQINRGNRLPLFTK